MEPSPRPSAVSGPSCYQSLVQFPRSEVASDSTLGLLPPEESHSLSVSPVSSPSTMSIAHGTSEEVAAHASISDSTASTPPEVPQFKRSFSAGQMSALPPPTTEDSFLRPVPKLSEFAGLLCRAYRELRTSEEATAENMKLSLLTVQARDLRMLRWEEERTCSMVVVQATLLWTGMRGTDVTAGEDLVKFTLQRSCENLDETLFLGLDAPTDWHVTDVVSVEEANLLKIQECQPRQGHDLYDSVVEADFETRALENILASWRTPK